MSPWLLLLRRKSSKHIASERQVDATYSCTSCGKVAWSGTGTWKLRLPHWRGSGPVLWLLSSGPLRAGLLETGIGWFASCLCPKLLHPVGLTLVLPLSPLALCQKGRLQGGLRQRAPRSRFGPSTPKGRLRGLGRRRGTVRKLVLREEVSPSLWQARSPISPDSPVVHGPRVWCRAGKFVWDILNDSDLYLEVRICISSRPVSCFQPV